MGVDSLFSPGGSQHLLKSIAMPIISGFRESATSAVLSDSTPPVFLNAPYIEQGRRISAADSFKIQETLERGS
jgi:hypothetical protein